MYSLLATRCSPEWDCVALMLTMSHSQPSRYIAGTNFTAWWTGIPERYRPSSLSRAILVRKSVVSSGIEPTTLRSTGPSLNRTTTGPPYGVRYTYHYVIIIIIMYDALIMAWDIPLCTSCKLNCSCAIPNVAADVKNDNMFIVHRPGRILASCTIVVGRTPAQPDRTSGVARAPQAPRPRGARGAEGARQEEVFSVTPWPGAQTSCWRGPENRRYATGQNVDYARYEMWRPMRLFEQFEHKLYYFKYYCESRISFNLLEMLYIKLW